MSAPTELIWREIERNNITFAGILDNNRKIILRTP